MNRKLLKQFLTRPTGRFMIFVVTLLTILCLIPVSRLKIDFNPMQLLNNNDPDKITYDQLNVQFNASSEEQSIFIALKNNQGIFDNDFLTKVDSLTRFLLHQKQILRVYSLCNANLVYFNGKDVNARPLLHVSQPEYYKQDSVYLFQSKEFRDLLVSKNGDCIAIGAFNDTALNQSQKNQLIKDINSKINELHFDEAHVVSRIQIENDSLDKAKLLAGACLVFLFVVIIIGCLLLKYSAKEILISLAIILTKLIWLLAIVSLGGYPLNFISAGIILLVFIIASIVIVCYNLANLSRSAFQSFSIPVKIICSALIILLTTLSIYFICNKKADFHLSDAISKKTTTFADLNFIDKNFYGSRPFELVLAMKNDQQSFYDIDIMNKEQEVENYLRDSLQVGAIISPMSLFKGANKAFHNGSIDYFKIPDSTYQVKRFAEAIMQTEYADEFQRRMLASGGSIRINGRLPDMGVTQFNQRRERLQKFMNQNYSQLFSYKLTGNAIIYDKLIPYLGKILPTIMLLTISVFLLSVFNFGHITINKNHLKI